MPHRFWALVVAVAVAAALPAHALADDRADVVLAAKGADMEGPNAPPDLLADVDVPTAGDSAGLRAAAREPERQPSVQVNDPTLDHVVSFPTATPPQRPFELSIQSETSVARFGDDVVTGFNNSADQPVMQTPQGTLAFQHRFLSGVGASHDGGRTWTEYSLPPIAGSPFTFGDPALAVDRHGNFYYASLGADASGNSLIFVGKSTDRGRSFQPGVTAAVDPGSDKEWIAVGRDPVQRDRDNVYVTWTSFQFNAAGQTVGSQLRLARSTDGGQTWSLSTLFAPVADQSVSAFIQFSNPVVDPRTGRLFVPFLHFGAADTDFIRMLVSDDGGLTFHLATFDAPGAPDPNAFPNITPGTLTDCGVSGGFRSTLHAGADQGGGRLGLPRFRNATRLVTQPSLALEDGRLFMVFNSSTSQTFGDPASHSEIRLLFSPNGGERWLGPFTVAPATAAEPQHVHPAVSVSGGRLTVGYFTQQADDRLRVDAVSTRVGDAAVREPEVRHLSPAFDLIPSNVAVPAMGSTFTTNYDRTIRPCYNVGEYMGATALAGGRAVLTWGDNRNSWTSPPESPAAGSHSQPDVFAGRV